ncbi:MAG TPA: hypothetical protein VHT30_04190 [Acidimicrobiales bacterium]|jgi:Tfp pilus assembly protein PilX|nr:hypothetical protein [Acidimicrobiales bacterium]
MLSGNPKPGRGRSADESGLAMIMALIIMMVCVVVVSASILLAIHSGQQSSVQRNETAALHAADYGLQEELASLAGQPSVTGATCTPITTSATAVPNASLPAEWYLVSMPGCTATSTTRTVIATGYALGEGINPSVTRPPSTAQSRVVVAHITLQPAGALSSGGYGFPDALLSLSGGGSGQSGNLTGTSLTVSGVGTYAPTVRADGTVSLTSSNLSLAEGASINSLSAWGNATLSATTVTGDVTSSGTVTLSNASTVTAPSGDGGNVIGSSVTNNSSTVSGSIRQGTNILPTKPPVPTFTYNVSDWLSLTGSATASSTCPTSGTLSGLYYVGSTCSSSPTSVSGTVAIVYTGTGTLTVNLPSSTGGTALYLIAPNGSVSITDSGTAMPVFVYGGAGVTTSGTIVGQLAGGNIATAAATSVLAELVGAPPDFSFPASAAGTVPPTGFVPEINDEYLCPAGTTSAC